MVHGELLINRFPKNAVLLIIDVQKGMDDPLLGQRNNPDAEQHMVRLLAAWRASGRPVIHVQHLSTSPGSPLYPTKPGVALKDEVQPQEGETLIQKQVNSAFIGTNLEEQLKDNGCDLLVIVGLTTPHCVSTTARMAGNLGFKTTVVADATAAFETTDYKGRRYTAEEVHNLALAALNGEFAAIVETEEILAGLTTSERPAG